MSIRITGMNSGLDTDAMVQELVSAYDKKTETYRGSQKKLQWKQDAWQELNTKVKNFVSKSLNNMRFSANYQKKTTTVSNTSVASVVSSDNAVNGRQSLKVSSLAQSAYLTGGKVTARDADNNPTTDKVTSETTLSALGYKTSGTITLTKGTGTEPIEISVDGDMTIARFVDTVAAAGLNASFDEANGRIFVSAQESGSANNFSFGGDTAALSALGLAGVDGEGNNAKMIEGSDATIWLNKVQYTSGSNSFSINGLRFA